MIIDPRGMTSIEWTDSINLLSSGKIPIQRLDDPDKWREWAANLMQSSSIGSQNIPNPYQFENFEDWAMKFNLTVDLEAL